MSLHAVILAGGSGTRFWPLSRARRPKQFLPLVTGKALIAETHDRVRPLCDPQHVWVVCGPDHAEGVRSAVPDAQVIVEPAARNTAPAIGLAAVRLLASDPDATMFVLPSDHHIADPDGFREALSHAARVAADGSLVELAIRPTRPETGYGYLRRGAERPDGGFTVDAFVEKPDAKTAARYLQDSAYSWNAGIFVFRADVVLEALHRHQPAIHEGLLRIGRGEPAAEIFPRLPSISIDYGVLEPEARSSRRLALIPADIGWSDVGSFAALPGVRALDPAGNAIAGDAVVVDCEECVVMSEGDRLVAAVGLRGLCIVDAGDAVLVVPREKAQDVRKIVDALREKGRTDKL